MGNSAYDGGGVQLVSVILPTIGSSPFLMDAVNSILNQSYTKIELIIVNDSKNYMSIKRVNNIPLTIHDERIRIICTYGVGLPAARNAGLKVSAGEYLLFCDDDDLWVSQKIEAQIDIMRTNEFSVHMSNFSIISHDGAYLKSSITNCEVGFPVALNLDFMSPPSGWALRRHVIATVGLFDESFRSTEDKEFILRCSKYFKIIRSGPLLWSYRISEQAISRNVKKKLRYNIKLIRRYRYDLLEFGDHAEILIRFAVKLAIANKKARAQKTILSLFLKSNASLSKKIKLTILYFMYSATIRRTLKGVS